LIQKSNGSDGGKFGGGKMTLSDEDREILAKLVNEEPDSDKTGEKYSL
jgi:hypothetical protein